MEGIDSFFTVQALHFGEIATAFCATTLARGVITIVITCGMSREEALKIVWGTQY